MSTEYMSGTTVSDHDLTLAIPGDVATVRIRLLEAIQQLTHGIPRRINRLCDLALLVGYGEELPSLTGQHIESIHQELIGAAAA